LKNRLKGMGVWLSVLVMVLLANTGETAGLKERVQQQEISQVLRLRVGQSKVVTSTFPLTRISVADPEVADIILINEKEI